MATKSFYAHTVNTQVNVNDPRKDWDNLWYDCEYAIGNPITNPYHANSEYMPDTYNPKSVPASQKPHVLAVHDFHITADEIPKCAYINGVTFEVGIKIGNPKAKIKAPHANFMIYGGSGKVTQHKKSNTTGWYGGTYRVYPNKKLTTSLQPIKYKISGKEWNKKGYSTERLYHNIFGIDLHFEDIDTPRVCRIFIQYIKCTVDYEVADYKFRYDEKPTSEFNPREVNVDDIFSVNLELVNKTKSNCGTQTVDILLPEGVNYYSSTWNLVQDSQNPRLYHWNARGIPTTEDNHDGNSLFLTSDDFGLKELICYYKGGKFPYYLYVEESDGDYEGMLFNHGLVKENKQSCWTFKTKVQTNNLTVTFYMDFDGNDLTDLSKVSSSIQKYLNNGTLSLLIGEPWLSEDSAIKGFEIVSYDYNQITFSVPDNNEHEIKWSACYLPLFSGENQFIVTQGNHVYDSTYTALPDDGLEIHFQTEESYWTDNHMLFDMTLEGNVLRCDVKENDRVMIEGDCTLQAHMWEDLAYIGCIPVQTSHYDPKTDFTNALLKETYKNKTYMGKENSIEEKISLNIKLPPRDWTTLEGLVRLDKPVPVNLVPKAFEGDVLNHRGWVELYGLKGISKTNPLYYDGEIEVAYLSHNINTRFTIEKGKKSYNFPVSSIMGIVVESGDEFANYTYTDDDGDIVSNNTGYFNVSTDGVYIYDNDEETDDSERTLISMDSNQYINIKSADRLASETEIDLHWKSTKIREDRENNIERIIYITKDNQPIFKYQYSNFDFNTNDEYYTCTVLAEVLNEIGEWDIVYDDELILDVDVESLQLTTDSDGNIITEPEPVVDDEEEEESEEDESYGAYVFNDFVYGSTLMFHLEDGVLYVTDEGFNGHEISFSTSLLKGEYYYDLQFRNLNDDADTEDVITFFDFEVNESLLLSDSRNYGNMYISSFPVANKQLLFTRKCNEGTIYYFKDDGGKFTYIQNPFYMYFCGVDIENEVGSSLFTLDNSYSVFYLDNGLVRLGFNRFNGDLYLSKYDPQSEEYIRVATLNSIYTDYSIGTFSDDKIEIKAGKNVYTMYRGHPYVIINHPKEDIRIDTNWNEVWSEQVNNDSYDTPMYWDLANHSNLLPKCVGGRDISAKCLEIDYDYVNQDVVNTVTLGLEREQDDGEDVPILNDYPSIWTIDASPSILNEGVIILVDGEATPVIKVSDGLPVLDDNDDYVKVNPVHDPQFAVIFPDNNEHTIRAVYCGDDTTKPAYSDLITIVPEQLIIENPDTPANYKLEIVKLPSKYTYMSNFNWQWKLTRGGKPVQNKSIEIDLPNGDTIVTEETNSKGLVTEKTPDLSNKANLTSFRNWKVGTVTVQARFYNYDRDTPNRKVLHKVSRKVTISKGTPKMKFTKAKKKGKQAKFKLCDPKGYPLANKKVLIKIGGNTKTKTTDSKGFAKITVNKSGHYTYKVTYKGDDKLKKKTFTFEETVKK